MPQSALEQGLGSRNVGRFVITARPPHTGEGCGMNDGIHPLANPLAKRRVDDGSPYAFHAQCREGRIGLSSDASNSITLIDQLAAYLGPKETTVTGNQNGGDQLPAQYRSDP